MKTYAVLFALAFLASFAGTPLLRRLSLHWGLLDSAIEPGSHRRRPVPRLGGVIIYSALLGTLLALFFPSNVITEEFRAQLPTLGLLWGPATMILLVGVADDIWGVRASVKLIAQVAAALWLVSAGIRISRLSLPWGQTAELGALSTGVTLLWLVGVTNAFNLIDGLDGLAAGVAFLSASAIAVTAVMIDAKMVVVITVALAGALLGFLRHNFSPATIFLGDSGSMFVGFVLAAAAVVWHQKSTTVIAVAAPVLAFGLPVADTTLTVLRRYLRRQSLFTSDRHHIHHRLLALGFTPRQAVTLLYTAAGVAALGCILIARGHNLVTATVVLAFMGVFLVLGYWVHPEFSEFIRVLSRRRVSTRLRAWDAMETLRAARSWEEFCEGLPAVARLLEVDLVEIQQGADEGFHWQEPLPGWGLSGGSTIWSLSVPLPAGGHLRVGRDPLRNSFEWPLEVVAKELGATVEETLASLERQGAGVAAASDPGETARPWAAPAKSGV